VSDTSPEPTASGSTPPGNDPKSQRCGRSPSASGGRAASLPTPGPSTVRYGGNTLCVSRFAAGRIC